MLLVLLIISSFVSKAQHYVPAQKGNKVEFKLHEDNDIIRAVFSDIGGRIDFDGKQLKAAFFDLTINTGTIKTGDAAKDETLKKEPFFNYRDYPEIRIRSDSVTTERPGSSMYLLYGHITMKGITKRVTVQFMTTQNGTGYVFRGSFRLTGHVFNFGNARMKDDEVSVYMEVKANKK